jgi:mannose-6-phosphate isomerase-like protein (cupin superfamily)
VDVQLLKTGDLPFSRIAHELVGADHGGVGVCVIFVDAEPGEGPSLHRHPYEEVFITLEGEAGFVVDGRDLRAAPGDIVIVPPHTAHAFTNSGATRLRQIDIHVSPSFSTEWLD